MQKRNNVKEEKQKLLSLGFLRVSSFSPVVGLCDCSFNAERIIDCIEEAELNCSSIALFPQLAVTGCSCSSLFNQRILTDKAGEAVLLIAEKTKKTDCVSVIGFPFRKDKKLFNAAAVIFRGELIAVAVLPQANLFAEFFSEYGNAKPLELTNFFGRQTAAKFGTNLQFKIKTGETEIGFCIGSGTDKNTFPDFTLIPLAENSFAGKHSALTRFYSVLSEKNSSALIIANAGAGESSCDYVFAGECGVFEEGKELCFNSFYTGNGINFSARHISVCTEIDIELIRNKKLKNKEASFKEIEETGSLCVIDFNKAAYAGHCGADSLSVPSDCSRPKASERINLFRTVAQNPFLSILSYGFAPAQTQNKPVLEEYLSQIFLLQAQALNKRLNHIKSGKVIIGASGGIDSTAVLLVCAFLFNLTGRGKENIYAFTLPGLGTTGGTKKNALLLAELLGCTAEEIPIREAVLSHFKDIKHKESDYSTVFENAQARERTQILMDKANQLGGIVLGTGDLSESALGWSTFNGDHMSMYAVNACVPKTVLKLCIEYAAENPQMFVHKEKTEEFKEVLKAVLQTPISPELLPPDSGEVYQQTEKILGSYDLHDFFIYHVCINGFAPKKVLFLAEQAFKDMAETEILRCLKLFYSRFFSNQFKRSCCPDSACVTEFSFSPRTSWKMPSEAVSLLWLSELEKI